MMQPNVVTSRGILQPQAAQQKFQISRHMPAPHLSFWIERYWIIDWDLRGQAPYVQETLPYPCVNVVFEHSRSGAFGVSTGKFARQLDDEGHVFGVKFKPGAFYSFITSSVAAFTNSALSIGDVFGSDGEALESAILAQTDKSERIALFEDFLTARLPEPDENIRVINQIVDRVIADPTITRVDDLVVRFGLNKRTLQRLFHLYVGVSPKWVIQRYRLHEAAEQLDVGTAVDWARLAVELGYYDQAHFIKDFKTIVGKTPAEYARDGGSNPD